MIKAELVKHLESSGVMSNSQHGFTRGRSCLTNLLETFEALTIIVEEGYGIDVIFLDFRKAFDSVSHVKLLQKLQSYGINKQLAVWIHDYLTNMETAVRVNGKLLSGVRQGSVLGSLLFLLFVNELPTWIRNSIKMFADDTKIWCNNNNNNNTLIYIAPACRMTSEALADSSSRATECLTEK